MSNDPLFHSTTSAVPRLRGDLDIIPIEQDGTSYLYFHDMRGYATPDFALDRSVGQLLSLLDGRRSVQQLQSMLGNGTSKAELLQFIQFLDEHRLLQTTYFRSFAEETEAEYEAASVHPSVTAGGSYPSDPAALTAFLDEAFEKHAPDDAEPTQSLKALYAPHIDPRVGMQTYVEAFTAIRHLRPKRVVLLATSHYAGLYPDIYENRPFIISDKDFEMPMGTVPTDRSAIKSLLQSADDTTGLTAHDRAHRMEHSIELHLLFLQYIWPHAFSIVPIIVSGFDDLYYMPNGFRGDQINAFSSLISSHFGDDHDTFFLISGDLAHVGKKFGDSRPANDMKREVAAFDEQFLAAGEANDADGLLQLISNKEDAYRICGFPPLYSFLKTFPDLQGTTLTYDRWDETERASAVTFGSILYSIRK